MKKVALLLVGLILASCESIPEIEEPYPADNFGEPRTNKEQLFTIPDRNRENQPSTEIPGSGDRQAADESSDPIAETEPASPDAAAMDAPELAEAHYPEQVPDEETAAIIPADEPIVQLPPQAPAVQPPAEQTPPPQRETPPAVPVSPPVVTTSPSAEEVPPEETPQEEPPQEEREPYTPPIPNMPFRPETAAPELTENELPYSRTVRAVAGQYIEIPFRGPGWVYLGEFGSRRGVRYDSRRMDPDGMTFVFRADAEGTYSLKFNRHDFVRDYILNDYVRVIVEEPPAVTGSSWSNSHVGPDRVYASPRWPLATDSEGRAIPPDVSAREQNATRDQTQAAPSLQVNPNPQAIAPADSARPGVPENPVELRAQENAAVSNAADGNPPAVDSTPPGAASVSAASIAATDPSQASAAAVEAAPQNEDLLKKAWDEYNAGRIPGALSALDQFMTRFPGGSDEAYWLYGQSLEANNEATRDIRLALDYYRRLTGEFPQSGRYDEARRRIAYLERFYFNIQ